MEKSKNVTLQGTLALLVLKSLEQAVCTPGASCCTSNASPGCAGAGRGFALSALHRMEQEGWIALQAGLSTPGKLCPA